MSVDRYAYVAQVLAYFGWLHDILLHNTRLCVRDILNTRETTSVLDACCGAGTLSRYLRECGIAVIGVDTSPSMLSLAREKVPDARFLEADLTDLALDEPVDAAVVAFSLHEMPEDTRVKVWKAMRKATKPGGPLVVVDFAASRRRIIGSKVSWKFVVADEKNIDRYDPGHFENFEEFMVLGGVRGWLVSRGEVIEEEWYFMWGNIGVLVVNA